MRAIGKDDQVRFDVGLAVGDAADAATGVAQGALDGVALDELGAGALGGKGDLGVEGGARDDPGGFGVAG